ncbi:MAG: recombination mediator RecR, partial [Candidatus Eremiobacterota bacterium]
MYEYPEPLERVIQALMRLPTVGPKTATRLALHLLKAPPGQVQDLAESIGALQGSVQSCQRCGNWADRAECGICANPRREASILCVVGDAREVAALERTGEFRGRYHVLGGLISPMDGIGPDQLRVDLLLERLTREPVEELILATNPTVAGEATALYLSRLLA